MDRFKMIEDIREIVNKWQNNICLKCGRVNKKRTFECVYCHTTLYNGDYLEVIKEILDV